MKKVLFLICILFTVAASHAFAQSAVAVLGTIYANTSSAPVLTTSDRITRSVGLNATTPGYTITNYKCTIAASGTTWGPTSVTGSALTPEIITKVKTTRGPNVIVTFSHIHASYGGSTVMLPDVILKYDQ